MSFEDHVTRMLSEDRQTVLLECDCYLWHEVEGGKPTSRIVIDPVQPNGVVFRRLGGLDQLLPDVVDSVSDAQISDSEYLHPILVHLKSVVTITPIEEGHRKRAKARNGTRTDD